MVALDCLAKKVRELAVERAMALMGPLLLECLEKKSAPQCYS